MTTATINRSIAAFAWSNTDARSYFLAGSDVLEEHYVGPNSNPPWQRTDVTAASTKEGWEPGPADATSRITTALGLNGAPHVYYMSAGDLWELQLNGAGEWPAINVCDAAGVGGGHFANEFGIKAISNATEPYNQVPYVFVLGTDSDPVTAGIYELGCMIGAKGQQSWAYDLIVDGDGPTTLDGLAAAMGGASSAHRRIFFVGSDNNLWAYDIEGTPGQSTSSPIQMTTTAFPNNADPVIAATSESNGNNFVFVLQNVSGSRQLWVYVLNADGSLGIHQNLAVQGAPADSSPLVAVPAQGSNVARAFYIGTDGNIHVAKLYQGDRIVSNGAPTPVAGTPLAGGLIGGDQKIGPIELYYWGEENLSAVWVPLAVTFK